MALNRREKALLTLPVFLGGVIGFYNWVHEPLFVRRSQAETRVEQVQGDLKRDTAKLAREGDLVARRSSVATKEQLVDSWVPGKNSAAMLIWYLSQAEAYSGARIRNITVGDRRDVAANGQPDTKSDASVKTDQQTKPAEASASTQANSTGKAGVAAKPLVPSPIVTVIQLDIKVDARFVEHLLFDQSVEQMPLFLNTVGFSLTRSDKLPADRLGKLLQSGDAVGAEHLLGASPTVSGTYHINLYFKSNKPGPATSAMQFGESAGRMDPFEMDGVGEFVQSLLDYYANSNTDEAGQVRGRGANAPPASRSGQMG